MQFGDPPPSGPRDRDSSGRPRNNRPRDGLGRPLPRGASGVRRQPEGQRRTPDETIAEGQRLLDDGMPFHAHEVFEDAWKAAPHDERELWRGLAQLAVGITHAARGNPRGGAALLRRGAASMRPYENTDPYGVDVTRLVDWSDAAAKAVRDGDPVAAMPPLRRRAQRDGGDTQET
ncbi:MAG TPA: DUF309 domain-containing protein [Jatrophihabitantaceae bacterium]